MDTNRKPTTPPSEPRREDAKPATRCWFCGTYHVTGSALIGAHTPGGGTRVAACATGTGCRDGRVRHGPPHRVEPHWPGEDCTVCSADRQRAAQRANQSRSAWHPTSSRSNRPQ